MKILIFSVAYHPFVGGAEVAVKEITDRIHDVEFHLVTVNLDGKQKKEEKIGNVFVHRVGGGIFVGRFGRLTFTVFGALKALSLHRTHSFNSTWAIMANYAGFAALFFKYIKPSVPFILTLQEGDPIDYIKKQVWFVYPLFVQIFRKADRIQAISNYLADFAKDMGAHAPIEVIPNGVDVSLFSREFPVTELEVLRNKIRENFPGGISDEIFLVTTSRLVVKNGIADVIRALAFLPKNVKFLVIGTGPLEQELNKTVRRERAEERVVFLGQVAYQDIPKYLKASDIFIRPSLSEGMGNSFIEAMAAGIPVIATCVGGIPDFLKENETGLFCDVQNPESVAEQVKKLLNDKGLKEKIVLNAQKMVQEKYDWKSIANAMNERVLNTKS